MFLKSSISFIEEFFYLLLDKIRKVYLNSNIYNKKISVIEDCAQAHGTTLNKKISSSRG